MRFFALLSVSGCAPQVCCSLGDALSRTTDGACADDGGEVVPDHFCDGLPTDEHGGTSATTMPTDRAGRCERFCAAETTSCPTDTACLESCDTHCPAGPSADDVVCAEAAAASGTACEDFDCWGFCS